MRTRKHEEHIESFANESVFEREDEHSRTQILQLTSQESLHKLSRGHALELQSLLQHGNEFGVWLLPKEWASGSQSPCRLRVDLLAGIRRNLSEQSRQIYQKVFEAGHPAASIFDVAILTCTRYLLLLRMAPAGMGKKGRNLPLGVRSIRDIASGSLLWLVGLSVSKWLLLAEEHMESQSPPSFPLSQDNILGILTSRDLTCSSEHAKKLIGLEIIRMQKLHQLGYWSDVPLANCEPSLLSLSNVAVPERSEQKDRDTHLPLPDEYLSEMGRKSLWLVGDLAPNLFSIISGFSKIWKNTNDKSLPAITLSNNRRGEISTYLKEFNWKDSKGESLNALPFPIRLSQKGGFTKGEKSWPPRTQGQIMALLQALQMAHYFVIALAMGARGPSEVLNLRVDSLIETSDGNFEVRGKTYKLVDSQSGTEREWPLPEFAAECFLQQIQLIDAISEISTFLPSKALPGKEASNHNYLWIRITSSRGTKLHDRLNPDTINSLLVWYAETLHMETSPGGQKFRSHRLRKSVARLVALAIMQATKILKDIFGHKAIEMTMHYILSNKELRSEIESVCRELRVLRAKEVIEDIIQREDHEVPKYGGPASLLLETSVRNQEAQLHNQGEKWGAQNILELAEVLTLQGQAWQVVREGVICTKFPGTESGPCNFSLGHPEPSRCRTHCVHRLEEHFLRDDVNGAIASAVSAYKSSKDSADELSQSFWAAQVRANIERFKDLKEKWLSEPDIVDILNSH